MSLQEIENLLSHKIGIDASIIGTRKITKAIETRRLICGVSNINNYWQILQSSNQEFNELVELIVVPETWFFRDPQMYNAIGEYVTSHWLNQFAHQKLRLLSVPCSTGEEPYSLAMKLLDIGLSPNQFHIDAIDISKISVAKAKKGIYGRNSFRGSDLSFQTRHFVSIGKEYQISAQVKNTVNFSQGNLLDLQFLNHQKPYNIILCRNVLIYFNSLARKITLQNLNRLLRNEGIILVASSETGELVNIGCEIIRSKGIFLGQKKAKILTKPNLDNLYSAKKKQIIQPVKIPQIKTIQKTKDIPISINQDIEKKTTQTTINTSEQSNLEIIRKLADQGHLLEAENQCLIYLQIHSTSAEAYLLLGEIHQAQGKDLQAGEFFQKAVYLDPKNSQALLYLILIHEKQGDHVKAEILRQRWQRLQ